MSPNLRGRRSNYNLSNAVNYAKLAFKSACRDQNAAEAMVAQIFDRYEDPPQRLKHLTMALALAIDGGHT